MEVMHNLELFLVNSNNQGKLTHRVVEVTLRRQLDAVEASLALEVTLHHDLREANVDGQVHELVGGGGPNVQNLCLSHAVRFGVLDVHGGRHLVALVVDVRALGQERVERREAERFNAGLQSGRRHDVLFVSIKSTPKIEIAQVQNRLTPF